MKIAFLVPAYNVRPWSADFVRRFNRSAAALRETYGAAAVVVFVDDGSEAEGTRLDDHLTTLATIDAAVIGARHGVNRGQGAALQTALDIARSATVTADIYVTFDSDGQHDAADVERLVKKLLDDRLNIVFGNRFAGDPQALARIPRGRRWLLRLAVAFENVVTGIKCGDAHNGLRCFDRQTAALINLKHDRMAHATEIKLIVAKHALRYGEIPVTIAYSVDRLRVGQHNVEAARILVDLVQGWWLQ
jgi:polyprenyl-phospho-N-acetylgalactosaminyl synthase